MDFATILLIFLFLGQIILLVFFLGVKEKIKEILTISRTERVSTRGRAVRELGEKLETEFTRETARAEAKMAAVFLETAAKADKQFEIYLQGLSKEGKSRLGQYVVNLENKLAEDAHQELASVQKALADYKQTRLAAVDENILAVTQRTIELVLKKKLTVADQADLVYEALEKAKEEKLV